MVRTREQPCNKEVSRCDLPESGGCAGELYTCSYLVLSRLLPCLLFLLTTTLLSLRLTVYCAAHFTMSSSPTQRGSTAKEHHMEEIEGARDVDYNHAGANGLNLTQTQTIGGMTISPELFEKLYLTPKVPRVGDYNKRFANPVRTRRGGIC